METEFNGGQINTISRDADFPPPLNDALSVLYFADDQKHRLTAWMSNF